MTIQQLSANYVKNLDPTKPIIETAYMEGANTIIKIVEDLIHQLREEGKGLWTASGILEKLEELKGEKEG